MEIKPNSNYGPVPVTDAAPAQRARRVQGDAGEFTGTEALQRALQNTPDIRPEAVARGREVVASTQYPPDELMRRLANMLAIEFGSPAARALPAPSADS